MPRSSSRSSPTPSRSFHAPSNRSVAPFQNPYSSVAPIPKAPTTGQLLKESVVSGVGSGIGFGIGSRMITGLFGAPTVNVAQAPPSQPPAFQQCQQNAIESYEKPLCMKLFATDVSYTEFKQCMESSDNQIHVCKEFLPKKD